MTTAILADDEPHLLEHLQDLLAEVWPKLQIVATAANGTEALQAIGQHQPDVAFLDIKMPGLTGLEVAQQTMKGTAPGAQAISPRTRVVFVTAYNNFAVDAFERAAVDYLLKPASAERLGSTVERLKAALLTQQMPDISALAQLLQGSVGASAAKPALRFIRASRGDTVYQVPVDEVLLFQSDNKVTLVQTAQHEYVIRTSLSELLEQLDGEQFWQVHRGSIVNAQSVLSAQRDMMGNMALNLRGLKTQVVVARGYQALFKQM